MLSPEFKAKLHQNFYEFLRFLRNKKKYYYYGDKMERKSYHFETLPPPLLAEQKSVRPTSVLPHVVAVTLL